MEKQGLIGPADGAKPRKVLSTAYEHRESLSRNNEQTQDETQETKHTVSADDLFPRDFMKRFTEFDSITSMFNASGLDIQTASDVELNRDIWEAFVKSHTRFTGWRQMKRVAFDEYCERHNVTGKLL